MNQLLVDFNSANAAETIQSILQDGTDMTASITEMAQEVSSFYDEFMLLLSSKNAKDIEQLRKSINEIELRRIVEKLRVKYNANDPAAQVDEALQAGKSLPGKFDEIERMKKKVLELKQSVISEIRSYSNP